MPSGRFDDDAFEREMWAAWKAETPAQEKAEQLRRLAGKADKAGSESWRRAASRGRSAPSNYS
jgi:hypothetical protein